MLAKTARTRPGAESPIARAADDAACAVESRHRLLDLSVGLVEDLRRSSVRPGKGPESFCSEFQICLPYRGLFVWHVGREEVIGDCNQVVFVSAGEPFRMSAPAWEGYAEMIITPALDVLADVAQVGPRSLSSHPLFKRRSWRADARLQGFRARFLHWALRGSHEDLLHAEELLLVLLQSALQGDDRRRPPVGSSTTRLIRRTKEHLATQSTARLRLVDVAAAVGASPAYLTDLFRRVEGVSLYKYLTHLRLSRALIELPHAEDLTTLALDLGFSSHSHFSFAFRRAFGSTPSEFREQTRTGAVPKVCDSGVFARL